MPATTIIRAAAALAALAMPAALSAQTYGYECPMTVLADSWGWMPRFVFIGHETGAPTAIVSDPIILYFNAGQPVTARVATENNLRITFVWELDTKSYSNQNARFQYRATYIKSSGELSMSGTPLGYDRSFQALGQCERKPLN